MRVKGSQEISNKVSTTQDSTNILVNPSYLVIGSTYIDIFQMAICFYSSSGAY